MAVKVSKCYFEVIQHISLSMYICMYVCVYIYIYMYSCDFSYSLVSASLVNCLRRMTERRRDGRDQSLKMSIVGKLNLSHDVVVVNHVSHQVIVFE